MDEVQTMKELTPADTDSISRPLPFPPSSRNALNSVAGVLTAVVEPLELEDDDGYLRSTWISSRSDSAQVGIRVGLGSGVLKMRLSQ